MRKKLSFLSAVLAASMLMGGSVNAQTQKFNMKDRMMRKAPKTSFVNKKMANATAFNMDPSKITTYNVNGDSLILNDIAVYEYVKPGLLSMGAYSIINDGTTYYEINYYKYNENDIMTEYLYGISNDDLSDVLLSMKINYTSDETVKDLMIKEETFLNQKEEIGVEPDWMLINVTNRVIKRDEKNRILSLSVEQGDTDLDTDENYKIECEYGEGENPISIKEYEKTYGELALETESSDIVWAECDNQVTDIEKLKDPITIPNSGKNRLSSMKHKIYYRDDYNLFDFHFDYDEKNRTTEKRLTLFGYEDHEISLDIQKFEYPDDYGSFKQTDKEGKDFNEDGVISEDETKLNRVYSETYDEQGNLVKEDLLVSTDGDSLVINGSTIYDIVYDDMMRISEIKISNYNPELKEYVYSEKLIYEYDDTATGIASVNRDNVNLKVNGNVVTFGSTDGRYVVCNADGKLVMAGSAADGWVSLENLPAGLYIVKVNGKAVKVIR